MKMKKANWIKSKFNIMIQGETGPVKEEVRGHILEGSGLGVYKESKETTTIYCKRCVVTHLKSGKRIVHLPKLKQAKQYAEAIGQIIDFTLSEEAVTEKYRKVRDEIRSKNIEWENKIEEGKEITKRDINKFKKVVNMSVERICELCEAVNLHADDNCFSCKHKLGKPVSKIEQAKFKLKKEEEVRKKKKPVPSPPEPISVDQMGTGRHNFTQYLCKIYYNNNNTRYSDKQIQLMALKEFPEKAITLEVLTNIKQSRRRINLGQMKGFPIPEKPILEYDEDGKPILSKKGWVKGRRPKNRAAIRKVK